MAVFICGKLVDLTGQNQELASVDLGPEVEARLEALTDIAEFLEVDDLRASTLVASSIGEARIG